MSFIFILYRIQFYFLINLENAAFINIGRSNVIKESDVLEALEKKWIRAVVLDVFDKEPLPEESKLWTTPQVNENHHTNTVIKFAKKIPGIHNTTRSRSNASERRRRNLHPQLPTLHPKQTLTSHLQLRIGLLNLRPLQ